MLRVLLVEDNVEKRQQIAAAVMAGNPSAQLYEAACIVDARRFLSEGFFDLMVLDIALPIYPDEVLVKDAGIALLREIMEYELYPKPRYLIGVTGHDDLSDLFEEDFKAHFWRLLSTKAGIEWRAPISKFVHHISKVSLTRENVSAVDVCLMTALASPEMEAIMRLPFDWQAPIRLDGSTYYRLGEFTSQSGRTMSISAACSLRMGPVAGSVLASKLVSALRPKLLGLGGICAGVRGSVELGDIVAASEVWSWETGKLVSDSGRPFSPEPVSVPIADEIVASFQQIQQDRQWLDATRAAFPGAPPKSTLEVRIAPMASGAPVVADSEVVTRITGVNRKTCAIEMEAFGALFATKSWRNGATRGFCVKSVCDFADEHKDDSWRDYAAYTSAACIRRLLERYGDVLVEDKKGSGSFTR